MNDFETNPNQPLDDCGCGEGISAATPVEVYNHPGLPAIAYRVGTYGRFRASMLARLSGELPAAPELEREVLREALSVLTARTDDFTIALISAWALAADVLTFYQERIANEQYIRTATERMSLLHLARLIGYKPSPGLAASTYLTFTMDQLPPNLPATVTTGIPTTADLDPGVKVQSIPGKNELPQTFETVEAAHIEAAWNALRPRLTQPQRFGFSDGALVLLKLDGTVAFVAERITLQGVGTNIRQGDVMLAVNGGQTQVLNVFGVETDAANDVTHVLLKANASTSVPTLTPLNAANGVFATNIAFTPSNVTTHVYQRTWQEADLQAFIAANRWDAVRMVDYINKKAAMTSDVQIHALRQRVGAFGYNAPRWETLPKAGDTRGGSTQGASDPYPTGWDGANARSVWEDSQGNLYLEKVDDFTFIGADLYLAREIPEVIPESWIVLSNADRSIQQPFRVVAAGESALVDFGISGAVTALRLEYPDGSEIPDEDKEGNTDFLVRRTSIAVQSEWMTLANLPVTDDIPVNTTSITLDRMVVGLRVGQSVLLRGEAASAAGIQNTEIITLSEIVHVRGFTTLKFEQGTVNSYRRDTLTINANTVAATHGETVNELLGSGNAAVPFQRFTLKQPPLTYVSAATASGVASTLEVYVGGVQWYEVETLYGHEGNERIFTTFTDDSGKTTVQFGDGITGARLPTGTDNVSAIYRKGTGVAGLIDAHKISLLMSRPLGLKDAINYVPAENAEDPEPRDAIRANAGLTVMTLDRIVSLRDYEDYARAYPGIRKALATWTWNGRQRTIFLTVAGVDGAPVTSGGTLHKNLLGSLRKISDSRVPVDVMTYLPAYFKVGAQIIYNPDYVLEPLQANVEWALRTAFSFNERAFGQSVNASDVIAVIQRVSGVIAVTLTALHRSNQAAVPNDRLVAGLPQAGIEGAPTAAELLLLDPAPLTALTWVEG